MDEVLFRVPWVVGLLGAFAWYAVAFRRARALGRPHPRWKLAAFACGLLLVGVATVSPLEHYGSSALWVNFLGFLVLTMMAAPLLVLGSPLTLAFRVSTKDGRRRLLRAYRGRVASRLTFPVFTWLAFAGLTYIWQFTRLTDEAALHWPVRQLQLSSLLAVSYLFWLPALCSDPQRWRMAYPLRVLYVFVEMTHKGLFGGMFLSMGHAFHPGFAARAATWAPSEMMDQRIAILILWIGGNIVFLGALIGIVTLWISYEGRNARRVDRRLALAREVATRRRRAMDQVFGKS